MRRLLFNRPKGIVQDGLVAEYRFDQLNRLKFSEDFSNPSWDTNNLTKTVDSVTAPDGRTTADTVTETAVNSQHRMNQFPASGANETHALSVYAKYGTRPWIMLYMANSGGTNLVRAWFDIQNGVLGTVDHLGNGSGESASIRSVGDGWYRCTLVGKPDTSAGGMLVSIYLALGNGVSSHLGEVSKYLYLWGAQLELGSASTAYKKTTDHQTLWNSKLTNLSVPNIVTNGNFAADGNGDGIADNWTSGSSILNEAVANNEQTFTGAGFQSSTANNWFYQSGCFANFADKFYCAVTAKRTNSAGSNRLFVGNGYNQQTTFTQQTYFTRQSVVFTPTNLSGDADALVFAADNGLTVVIKEIMLINLSALFGTGYEPTAAQCDEMFPDWFDGMITLNVSKHNGTLGSTSGSDTNDPTWDGQSLSFATDDYVSSGNLVLSGTDRTFEAVLYHTGNNDIMGLLLQNETLTGTASAKINGLQFSGAIAQNILLSVGNGVASGSLSAFMPLYSWRHVVGVIKGGTSITLYIDGKQVATNALAINPETVSRLLVLGRIASKYLNGKLAYGAVYDKALTQAEITQNYQALIALLKKRGITVNQLAMPDTYRTNLAAEYRFEEGQGQYAYDFSGLGRHSILGSTSGSDTNDPAWVTGGLDLDGTDNYVLVAGDDTFKALTAGSVECVFKVVSLPGAGTSAVAFAAGPKVDVNQGCLFIIYVDENGAVNVIQRNTDNASITAINAKTVNSIIQAGTVYHVIWDVGAAGNVLYINGTAIPLTYSAGSAATTDFLSAILTTQNYWFGTRRFNGSMGSYLNGEIYYGALYSASSTADQVQQNYNALKTYLASKGITLS